MRRCPHCAKWTPFYWICLWCKAPLDDNGQPDEDDEIDAIDFGCGCG